MVRQEKEKTKGAAEEVVSNSRHVEAELMEGSGSCKDTFNPDEKEHSAGGILRQNDC